MRAISKIVLAIGILTTSASDSHANNEININLYLDNIESDSKNIADIRLAIFRRSYGTTIAIPATPEALREIADQSCQVAASKSGISNLLSRIRDSRIRDVTKERDLFWGIVIFSDNKIVHQLYFGAPYRNVDYTFMMIDAQKFDVPVSVVSWLDKVIDMGSCKIN